MRKPIPFLAPALVALGLFWTGTAGGVARADASGAPAEPRVGPTVTAEGAVARAIETAPTLEEARAAARAADAAVALARAALLPRMSLSARYMRVGGFQDGALPVAGDAPLDVDQARALAAGVEDPNAQALLLGLVDQQAALGEARFRIPRNQVLLSAHVDVPLSDMVATIAPRIRAAKARAHADRLQIEAARVDVALAARQAFHRYVQARGSADVARASARRAELHRDRVRVLREAGRATDVDVLELEAHLARARGTRARAEAAERGAAVALWSLLHLDAVEPTVGEATYEPPPSPPPDPEALVRRAWADRPDLQALELMARAQGHQVVAERGDRYPRLGAFAGYDYGRPNPLIVPPNLDFRQSWRIGVALSWSPDGMVRAQHAAHQREAERARLLAQIDRARDQVRVAVLEAWHQLDAMAASHAAAKDEADAARARLEARQAELEAGRVTATALVDAELDVVGAEMELLSLSAQGRIAQARLWHALGRLHHDGA
jgi:outer membrane protein TolC